MTASVTAALGIVTVGDKSNNFPEDYVKRKGGSRRAQWGEYSGMKAPPNGTLGLLSFESAMHSTQKRNLLNV